MPLENLYFYWKKLTDSVIERNCGLSSYISASRPVIREMNRMRSVDSLSEVHAWFPRVGNSGVAPCVRLEEPANYGSIHSVCIVQQQNRCNFRDRAARTRRETRDRIRKQEDITSPVIELRILPKDRDREKERKREREKERGREWHRLTLFFFCVSRSPALTLSLPAYDAIFQWGVRA